MVANGNLFSKSSKSVKTRQAWSWQKPGLLMNITIWHDVVGALRAQRMWLLFGLVWFILQIDRVVLLLYPPPGFLPLPHSCLILPFHVVMRAWFDT
jgi:hypothetical protein